jgi:hypothetical protein
LSTNAPASRLSGGTKIKVNEVTRIIKLCNTQ